MPTSVVVALALTLLPQTPENVVEVEESSVRPYSNVRHGFGGRLVLPVAPVGSAAPATPQDPAGPTGTDEDFLRDAMQLRRSLFVPESKAQAILQQIGRTYDRIPERCLQLVRTSDPDAVHGLLRVLETYGRPEHARELEFLLLTRPFKNVTDSAVATMASIARDEAADRLFSCLTASRAPVRHHAADLLATHLRAEDAERLILLSQQAAIDVQIKALRLLGAVPPTPAVRARLIAALSGEARLAESAVDALIQHGPAAAADLQEILRRPSLGRETGYAALVLAALEDASPGTRLLTADMAEHLKDELDTPDPFQRGAVAVALAGLAWRSDDATGKVYDDKQVVEALVEIVAPTRFVAHLSTLARLAYPRLVLLSGRDLGVAQGPWRTWWSEVARSSDFVGSRQHVALDAASAVAATLTWRGGDRTIVLRGEHTRAVGDDDVMDYVVSVEELTGLVADLSRFGFMGDVSPGRGDADPRSLTLSVSGVVARSDPRTARPVLDRMGGRIAAVAHDNRWQLYRDPQREPDAEAFWRAERRWLEQHTDPAERADRLKARIVGRLHALEGARAQRAIEDLFAIPDLRGLLTEADGLALAEAARAAPAWDAETFRLLELALLAPGDEVWPRLLDVARTRDEAQGGDGTALRRIFGLAGPDRVLEALDADSALVRRIAMDEIAALQDLRAVPALVAAATDRDEDPELRRTAIYALGRLRAVDARTPLIAMLDDDLLDPGLRRTGWVALARIGGDEVFAVLQRAFPSPDDADRRAIVQALGAMQHARAARELANIFALRGTDTLGSLALEQLRQMGDLLASPALVQQLQSRNDDVRRGAAMLLGEFQNPAALGELFEMLREDDSRLRVVALIAGITGQNVTDRNDRVEQLRNWYRENGSRAQGEWLMLALGENGFRHTLTREQVQPGAGVAAIPELTRVVMDVEQTWLRCLASRVLRTTTGQDFGTLPTLASDAQRATLCDRYRFVYDASQAASGR